MISETPSYSDYIPDYLHNRLNPEVRRLFEKELETNATLRLELEEFKNFQKLYNVIDSDIPHPSAELLTRINAEIDSSVPQRNSRKPQKNSPDITETVFDFLDRLKQSFSLPWSIVALQAVLIVILIAPAAYQTHFQTLSRPATLQSSLEGENYNIVFKPTTTEAEIREFLLAIDATIVSGPSPQGKYSLVVPVESLTEQDMELLRGQKLILFFEKAY
jgi:hypothetical protein